MEACVQATYGGLDLAIEEFFSAETAWFSEYEPAPSKVLAHHWPGVPNLGDMTKIDWASVEPVDIVAGGTPCQDLSGAGKRKGMTEGTRSNLWVQMREAVAVIRPSIVVWENVRGAYSACADSEIDSELGRCPRCMDPKSRVDHAPNLRALGRVLGDLAELGYDAEWIGVRASDVGAPHERFRVFVVAYAAVCGGGIFSYGASGDATRGSGEWLANGNDRLAPVQDSDISVGGQWRLAAPGQAESGWAWSDARGRDRTSAADPQRIGGERWGEHQDMAGASGASEVDREQRERHGDAADNRGTVDWGDYRPAIERWERTLGRVAPSPTLPTGKGGAQRLSPVFVEWMMGLNPGWVTDPAIGLSRTKQLKALGNGVVPQQAELALSILWARMTEAAA